MLCRPNGEEVGVPVRALFFGTPEIAVPSLEALHAIAQVVGVVTQPNRPAGRGLELRPPPVKRRALELGLEVHQPTRLRTSEFAEWVASKRVRVALVIAYGRILPQAVLDSPERGCMNLHASLLPKYRGASPITWAVVHGEKQTGISLMQMDAGMDTGPVYSMLRTPIGPEDDAGELAERLARLAADVVRSDLQKAVDGELVAVGQCAEAATYAPILTKEQGRIDWKQAAELVHNHVRGMHPWPGAYTRIRGKTLKVLRTRVRSGQHEEVECGKVLVADAGGLVVACGAGTLELLRVQLEGRKALDSREFVAGRGLAAGEILG
jgi:methionyl-tRNA formyltransferase